MTELGLKAPAATERPAAGTTSGRSREVFLPRGARRRTPFSRLRERLCWPLGIYTTPVVVLIAWEVLARAGVVS
ncbi:ABC transporter permease, partial [Streptomyces sp. NPDC001286]